MSFQIWHWCDQMSESDSLATIPNYHLIVRIFLMTESGDHFMAFIHNG